MRSRAQLLTSLAAATLLLAAACGGSGGAGTAPGADASAQPQRGGTLTVLEGAGYAGAWPTGLDPATNQTGAANQSQMNAIYGSLFQLGEGKTGDQAEIVPSLASGYEISDDGQTVTINIRKDVKFQDGTDFNAEAVAFNFRRALDSPCTCAPTWPLRENNGITTSDEHTVVLHFTRPYAAVISSFPVSNVNWIASPTALEKKGEDEFKLEPVGAGPFEVVRNKMSSELVLKRNPDYWQDGRPYLDRLIFKTIGGDQAAYQALQAGEGDAFEGMTTTPLIKQARNNPQIQAVSQPATSPYVIQLNTQSAPFDNKKAREAIYYATNVQAIRKGLFNNWYPVSQGVTGPGGLFHHAKVPGYRTYDLQKAKQLVNELGGLEVTLGTLQDYVAEQVNTALQSQWQEAGIDVNIESYQLNALVNEFQNNKWDAMLQTVGAWDPAAGVGVPFRFSSDSAFSGVQDQKLDQLLQQAEATLDRQERDRLYFQASKRISDQAYAPIMFAFAPTNLAVQGVHAPGLTTKIPPLAVQPGIHWEEAWKSQEARS